MSCAIDKQMDLSRGIITGCDHNMEIFLPWWYDHLQKHCDLPIAILDYGLSDWGKKVAKKIGTLINKRDISIEKCEVDNVHLYPAYHIVARSIYLYKPFGLLQSPFEHTVWLDVDCKVIGSLDGLFTYPHFAVAKCTTDIQQWAENNQIFNTQQVVLFSSGTTVYKKDCPVILAWAEKTLRDSSHYVTEDFLLSELIAKKNLKISELPAIYSTLWHSQTPDSLILHYANPRGKKAILEEMIAKACGVDDGI